MNIIRNILKTIAAGIVAVGILSFLFSFYYLQPAHIDNAEGNTDYVWISDSRWFKMTEGISWGRFDTDGYNNPEVVENPDIIVLGSSHTEATNVPQGKEFASLLRDKLDSEYTVYNMGISGHNFLKVCQYLPKNLERYETVPEAVIIETASLTFSADEINTMLQGQISKSPSINTGVIALSQKSPFFATLYHQIQGGLIDMLVPDKAKLLDLAGRNDPFVPLSVPLASTPVMSEEEMLADAYSELFEYLGAIQKDYDTQIIIFLHPMEHLQSDGYSYFLNEDVKPAFIEGCSNHNIHFVDTTETFYSEYVTHHKLPHGFITGQIGFGHLNSFGHRIVADCLYDTIIQLQQEGVL